MKHLKIADGLALGLDFVTKTAAILAQRRKGKTYLASVIAEEMVGSKQPFVALDPTGAWWGLRASAHTPHEHNPDNILGGQHGDVPLERTGGRLIADLVVEQPGYYVIDFSLFESGEAERQFAVDFAERLYRAKGQAGRDFPLHLFVDEADRFIPQQMRKGSNETSPRLLGAFEAIVRRGGLRGIGTTLISQRAAVVNKNVLEMIDVLFTLRTVGPNDREAISDYIDAHGTDAERKEMLGSLASLEIGEAWVWEPGAEPALFKRVRIRARRTFNSSATPKPGQQRMEPKRLADVDLAALQERMAATIEKAKADDPRELRKQIADLQRQLSSERSTKAASVTKNAPTPPPKPVLTDADRALLEKVGQTVAEAASLMHEDLILADQRFRADIQRALEEYGGHIAAMVTKSNQLLDGTLARVRVQKILDKLANLTIADRRDETTSRASTALTPRHRVDLGSHGRQTTKPLSTGNGHVKGGKFRTLLVVLAQAGKPLTDAQLAARAVMSVSGTFNTYLGQFRQNGWLEGTRAGLYLTNTGLAAVGPFDPLPTGAELRDHWLNTVGAGKEREMLRVLFDAFPGSLTDDELADRAGMAVSGTFNTYIGHLRKLLLVSGTRQALVANAELFT